MAQPVWPRFSTLFAAWQNEQPTGSDTPIMPVVRQHVRARYMRELFKDNAAFYLAGEPLGTPLYVGFSRGMINPFEGLADVSVVIYMMLNCLHELQRRGCVHLDLKNSVFLQDRAGTPVIALAEPELLRYLPVRPDPMLAHFGPERNVQDTVEILTELGADPEIVSMLQSGVPVTVVLSEHAQRHNIPFIALKNASFWELQHTAQRLGLVECAKKWRKRELSADFQGILIDFFHARPQPQSGEAVMLAAMLGLAHANSPYKSHVRESRVARACCYIAAILLDHDVPQEPSLADAQAMDLFLDECVLPPNPLGFALSSPNLLNLDLDCRREWFVISAIVAVLQQLHRPPLEPDAISVLVRQRLPTKAVPVEQLYVDQVVARVLWRWSLPKDWKVQKVLSYTLQADPCGQGVSPCTSAALAELKIDFWVRLGVPRAAPRRFDVCCRSVEDSATVEVALSRCPEIKPTPST